MRRSLAWNLLYMRIATAFAPLNGRTKIRR